MQGYYKERKEEGQTKHIYIHENHAGPASVGACACPLLNLADPKWKKLRDIHHKIILKNIALHLFWSSWLRNMKYQITDGFLNVAILFKFWSIILERKKEWWKPNHSRKYNFLHYIQKKDNLIDNLKSFHRYRPILTIMAVGNADHCASAYIVNFFWCPHIPF